MNTSNAFGFGGTPANPDMDGFAADGKDKLLVCYSAD
jgi:hypothetical protein